MKFAINSHVGSYQKTFDKITTSLLNSGIRPDDIYFFIGGYSNYEYYKIGDINVYRCDNNSIDFTTLISIIDLNLYIDNFFIMHDTAYVGENFYFKVLNEPIDCSTISLTFDGYSMNMGLYTKDHIIENKNQILSLKNIDYSIESLQHWKKEGIKHEDRFLHPKIKSYNYTNRQVLGEIDYYETGTKRILEYFPEIDFYKIKANWHVKEQYELNL